MTGNRKIFTAALGAMVLSLAVASFAWACTGPQASISIVPRSAAAAQTVKVVSEGFVPGQPLEIRWNSAEGPIVGNRIGPDKAVAVTPPADAAPGLYYLVVIDRPSGIKMAADAFELTGPTNSAAKTGSTGASSNALSADLWAGLDSNASSANNFANSQPTVENSRTFAVGIGLVATAGVAIVSTLALAGVVRRRRPEQSKP